MEQRAQVGRMCVWEPLAALAELWCVMHREPMPNGGYSVRYCPACDPPNVQTVPVVE